MILNYKLSPFPTFIQTDYYQKNKKKNRILLFIPFRELDLISQNL